MGYQSKRTHEEDLQALQSRLEDMRRRAQTKGELAVGDFLSPREVHFACQYLKLCSARYLAFGGYSAAERKRIYLLPDYMEDPPQEEPVEYLRDYGYSAKISAVRIRGSGFETLLHRDFMGAVLGLGIRREMIGDISVSSDRAALVLCDEGIADFLCHTLERVGRDSVICEHTELPSDGDIVRNFSAVSDTVASARLDCVVAALCGVSRERAKQIVRGGYVELDYEVHQDCDKEVLPPCVLSARGYGKFRVLSLGERTKKGRYRLTGEKYL